MPPASFFIKIIACRLFFNFGVGGVPCRFLPFCVLCFFLCFSFFLLFGGTRDGGWLEGGREGGLGRVRGGEVEAFFGLFWMCCVCVYEVIVMKQLLSEWRCTFFDGTVQ